MLGGDEEDNLEDLIADCNNQVERPNPFNRDPQDRPTQGSSSSPQDSNQALQNAPCQSSVDPTVRALIAQNNRLQGLMENMVKQTQGHENKRKCKDDVSLTPEEPLLIVEEAYKLEDDKHDKVDTRLRQRLGTINACPTTYWDKEAFFRVERPILGAALYLEHLMPGNVAEPTLCKHHDRCAYIEIKNYLTKSGPGDSEEAQSKGNHL